MNSGSRLRNVHLATALAKRCSVTLLRILQPEDLPQAPPETQPFEALLTARKQRSYSPGMVLRGMLGPMPVTVLNYVSTDVSSCLRAALASRPFDAVQLESSNLFSYLDVIRSAPNSPAVLMDWHNIDSELMSRYASEATHPVKRLVARRTARLISNLESKLMRVCDAHTVVSELDKRKLLEQNAAARVTVIPNGVDSAVFSPSRAAHVQASLLFVGSMDYHANVDAVLWFLREVWPGISSRFPSLTFKIVGRSPTKEIAMSASDRIIVTGTVDDVRPFYADAIAVVVPLRIGGGTRLKILEGMAMGVPVVSTAIGAEGIAATNGRDILLANSAAEITQALERVIRDASLRDELSKRGRELVCQHYDWSSIGDRLYGVYSELMATRSGLLTSQTNPA